MLVAAPTVGTMTDRLKSHTKQSIQAAYRTNLPQYPIKVRSRVYGTVIMKNT